MGRHGNIRGKALTALLFIVLEAAALFMVGNSDIIHRQWAMRGIIASRAALFGTAESINDYFRLRKTNDSLAETNAALMERLYQCMSRLPVRETDTSSTAFPGFELIPAKIVKGSVNRQDNYFILDKGENDGITTDMGVITDKAVVGIVDAVSAHYSYVISFMSPEMNISARLGHSGITGSLVWDGKGSRSAILSQIPLHTEIIRGDTVYTSGFSNLYPADIPIGIAEETEVVDGVSLDVKIRLLQEFRGLRYVNIVRNPSKAEIDSLAL